MLMDNIFMTRRKFVINKIKKVDGGWNLFPVDEPSLPIFIRRLSLLTILSSCAEKLLRRRCSLNGNDLAFVDPFSCLSFYLSDPELIEKEAHKL